MTADSDDRLENGLKWIRQVAMIHYMGQAYDPRHMLALVLLCDDLLSGGELKDYDQAISEAKNRATEVLEGMKARGLIEQELEL